MALGATIRSLFGPYEHQVTDAYRAVFVDLDDWMARIAGWVPQARNILEIGCGEGAMTERLAQQYPSAHILAIDVTPRLGRLYRGDPSLVTFRQVEVETIARDMPGQFDLVLLSDVIHHVPHAGRTSLLEAARATLAPDATFIFKEWVRKPTPIHWLCEAGDRYLTGDDVAYLNAQEAHEMICGIFGAQTIRATSTVRPWSNNLAMLLRPAS